MWLFARHGEWITPEGTRHATVAGVVEGEVRRAKNRLKNWRGIGLDQISEFLLLKFTSISSRLAHNINQVINRSEEWLLSLAMKLSYFEKIRSSASQTQDRSLGCHPSTNS